MVSPVTGKYDWILAITTIAFIFSAFGNGANDVANSYATSVAAKTLTMPQVGVLSVVTEFVGAVALGARVTDTIKNGIISIDRFTGKPGALMLAMGCAEVGSATWLMTATTFGWPVSTTQTVVGALIGVGFASESSITWEWKKGSVSQVAASWAIAPLIAAGFSAVIFATLKYSVLDRRDSFKWAMRLIPVYFAMTGAILALFLVIEMPDGTDLEDFGVGKIVGIILGVFFGCMAICLVFFIPFFKRKLIMKDPRVRIWHVPMGPLLLRENCNLYFPGKGDEYVKDYYQDTYGEVHGEAKADEKKSGVTTGAKDSPTDLDKKGDSGSLPSDIEQDAALQKKAEAEGASAAAPLVRKMAPQPYERFIGPVLHLSWTNPQRWWGYVKYGLLQGVTRDVITHDSALLRSIHGRANRYDDRVEHLWTYCQVVSAIMMSIAHGSNDVANAVGPWAAVYETYKAGVVSTENPTPVWFLVVAGLLLGLGFWFYGFKIVRALGNKITQMSPTRGFSIELGAAITVLLASRLSLPVSTTQCLVGASMGVALMNYDLGAVNWRQLAFIFMGWVLTLPCAGLISGLLCVMALNAPSL